MPDEIQSSDNAIAAPVERPAATQRLCSVCSDPLGLTSSDRCPRCRQMGWTELPFAASPCRKCGITFRSTNPGKAKYCSEHEPGSTKRMRVLRQKQKVEEEARLAAEQLAEQQTREAKERAAAERREARRQEEIAQFGLELVRERDTVNMLATLLNEAVCYAKGEESVITNDDDFAELSDDFERTYARHEYFERQNYAIEFAFLRARDKWSTGTHSMFQQKFDWLCKAFPAQLEVLKSVPELPLPPEDLQQKYWTGIDPAHPPKFSCGETQFVKPVLPGSWSNVHARTCLPIIREHMRKIGKQISEFEQPPIVAPWLEDINPNLRPQWKR